MVKITKDVVNGKLVNNYGERKFVTIVEYFDNENGEELTEKEVKNEYFKKKQTIRYSRSNEFTRKHITWECERNRQQKLEF